MVVNDGDESHGTIRNKNAVYIIKSKIIGISLSFPSDRGFIFILDMKQVATITTLPETNKSHLAGGDLSPKGNSSSNFHPSIFRGGQLAVSFRGCV